MSVRIRSRIASAVASAILGQVELVPLDSELPLKDSCGAHRDRVAYDHALILSEYEPTRWQSREVVIAGRHDDTDRARVHRCAGDRVRVKCVRARGERSGIGNAASER